MIVPGAEIGVRPVGGTKSLGGDEPHSTKRWIEETLARAILDHGTLLEVLKEGEDLWRGDCYRDQVRNDQEASRAEETAYRPVGNDEAKCEEEERSQAHRE